MNVSFLSTPDDTVFSAKPLAKSLPTRLQPTCTEAVSRQGHLPQLIHLDKHTLKDVYKLSKQSEE